MRDVNGTWSNGIKTVDKQPASNRPGGSNVPDAGNSGNFGEKLNTLMLPFVVPND